MCKSVCFLLTEHPFLDARIFKKEAKSLLNQGYQVTMIVPRKKGYLFDVDGSIFRDRFRSPSFVHEGIKVVTYEQMYPEKNSKALLYNLRSERYTGFTDPLTKLGIEQNADIYHAHEFFSLYSGVGIKRNLATRGKKCKLIYDSHELEPDPLVNESQNKRKIKTQMLECMLKELDYVITVSESIKSWYLAKAPGLPIKVIYNSPPLASKHESGRGKRPELLLVYEGMMNPKKGNFSKLMKIVELCNEKFDLRVKIIGGEKVSNRGLTLFTPPSLKGKVEYIGWVDYNSISDSMKEADIGWIDFDAAHSLNNRFAMPNKFFSYLNNGVPILVNQCKDMESFIQTYQCGYVVKKRQATAEDYFQALLSFSSNRSKIHEMGLQARKVMESTYSWEHMEKILFAVYDQLEQDL